MFKKMVFIVASAFLALCFTGCGDSAESPEIVVTNFLNAVKASDEETVSSLSHYDEDYFYFNDTSSISYVNQPIRENLAYEILSSDVQKDTATVTVSITNVDLSTVTENYISRMESLYLVGFFELPREQKEELQELTWVSAFEGNKETTITKEIDITLVKENSNWIVQIDKDLVLPVMGEFQ